MSDLCLNIQDPKFDPVYCLACFRRRHWPKWTSYQLVEWVMNHNELLSSEMPHAVEIATQLIHIWLEGNLIKEIDRDYKNPNLLLRRTDMYEFSF